MAKISRYNGNLQAFGVNSTGNYRTIFGDVSQSDALDDNVNADYLTGWEIIGITEAPSKQDFNALGFTQGQLLAYLHQMGTPEYNASQEYYSDSICTYDGIIYISLTDGNTGNTPDASPSNWDSIISSTFIGANYYSKTELDAGQLDNRYYTETELDAGQLDNRYYTETELDAGQLDNRYYTEAELDAGQLDNRYYTEAEITSLLSGYILSTEKGAVNGVCPLDGSGLVDSSYLPSYVDDIIEVATYSALPVTGETGKIYIITTDGDGHVDEVYRWSGSVYVQIGSNILQADDSLKLGGQLPAYYATDSDVVHIAGDETITGNKTLYGTLQILFNGTVDADDSSILFYAANYDSYKEIKWDNTANDWAVDYVGGTNAKLWHSANDGAGSGLDSDTVDGIEGANLLRSDTADTMNGALLISTDGEVLTLNRTTASPALIYLKNQGNLGGLIGTDGTDTIFYNSSATEQLRIKTDGNLDVKNHAILNIDWANSDDGTGSGLDADTVRGMYWYNGAGSPESVVTAVPGSLYSNTSGGAGTTLYVKESGTGNTGWVAK